ncbi:PREDICTED: uncharacterized protein LOC105556369 [Vollenhovia emeryi]|uniref:uncharacterized protein LOC105556369 n=1 Tax=Vollenhovia emeryi TaxID=411798 RepID=UPI0005F56D5E|nr:PREDICTED: uncharacterized protein LOC105556369 [Vollenhovia emeryi]
MEIRDREKLVKQIEKTCDSIRKKYRALKTGKMEEDMALERHFKPIVEPLKKIVENTVGEESNFIKTETAEKEYAKPKRKQSNVSFEHYPRERKTTLNETAKNLQPRELSYEHPHTLSVEEIFENPNEPLVTSVRHKLQTVEGQKILKTHYGTLGQKYLGAVLSGKKSVNIDSVYGVYFSNNGTMIGNKRIDLDKNDDIIVDGKKYTGTQGLYELIFKKFPEEDSYTKSDKRNYKSILLATNAHRRDHNMHNPVNSNKGHKYRNIIAPLLKGVREGMPCTVTLNNNKIDYVHWDDPNELVDRFRLLEASRQAGHNDHDNEIMSIIEELREAGLIIN